MSKLRHEKQTYEIRGWIFEVQNTLGKGWSEEVYHQGMVHILEKRGIPFLSKPKETIYHRGQEVHTFECDLLVWDLIILEFKNLPFSGFAPAHFTQLIQYLKCWKKDLGLLVNFGRLDTKIERIVWDEPGVEKQWRMDFDETALSMLERESLYHIQTIVEAIGRQYGLGYPETFYRDVISLELNFHKLKCQPKITIPVKWGETLIAQQPSSYLLIEDVWPLRVFSLLDRPTHYHLEQMRTFLKQMGLERGIIVNFGKKNLQFHGISTQTSRPPSRIHPSHP